MDNVSLNLINDNVEAVLGTLCLNLRLLAPTVAAEPDGEPGAGGGEPAEG